MDYRDRDGPDDLTREESRESVSRLSRDMVAAASTLGPKEARFLVDQYYLIQDERIRVAGQLRSMGDEPNELLGWMAEQSRVLENQIKRALDRYSDSHALGRWARSNIGVGPVIAAGLLAHINLTETQTAGRIWSYAGLAPGIVWAPKTRRPWNADLKVLCYKMGESFVKFQNHQNPAGQLDCPYGRMFVERKARDQARNEAGDYVETCIQKLKDTKISKSTDAYQWYSGAWVNKPALNPVLAEEVEQSAASIALMREEAEEPALTNKALQVEALAMALSINTREPEPRLPPAHIHARARRHAVKMFLSHYFEVGLRLAGRVPPNPFAIEHMGHVHYIAPPNMPREADPATVATQLIADEARAAAAEEEAED